MSREFSRHELYAMGMPFGDGATRTKPGGRGRIYGGGGGGGVKYDNLEKLYETQVNQANRLADMSEKYVYPAFGEFMDSAKGIGSQANQEAVAGQAAADVAAAQGGAKQQLSSDLASMGVNPADAKYANTMADMDMNAAAQSASAQTGARDRQRQLGRAAQQDAISLGMGVSSNATAALGSAGSTAGGIANIQSQNNAVQAQNNGNVAALATRLMFKDGGMVKRPQGHACGGGIKRKFANGGEVTGGGIPKYAAGGFLRQQQVTPPQSVPQGPSTASRVAGSFGSTAVASGPTKLGAGIQAVGDKLGIEAVKDFGQGMQLGNSASSMGQGVSAAAAPTGAGLVATAAPTGAGAAGAGVTASGGTGVAGGLSAVPGAGTSLAAAPGAGAAVMEGAGTGISAAAGTGTTLAATEGTAIGSAALGAGSAVAAALPWVGGAMLIGSALGLFKDGGSVAKKKLAVADARKGGKVSGPGGPKDDMVPAMLSDGEFVMPIGSVKLFGKDKLEQMRQQGLAYEKQVGIGA